MPKRILIIGMLNSIHIANWLERIEGTNLEIYLFPSRQYRKIHPKIAAISKQSEGKIKVIRLIPSRFSTYLEFALDTRWLKKFTYFSRTRRLTRILRNNEFSKIHAIEIQHAGYLLLNVARELNLETDVIVTNWGSDIFYFADNAEERRKIQQVLKLATHYSAECRRDYKLAFDLGFRGENLPVIPNSTTFPKEHFIRALNHSGVRDQIIVKSYGSTFGLGGLLLPLINDLLLSDTRLKVFCYSVTSDLYEQVNELERKYRDRFRYSTVEKPLSHEQILEEFFHSFVYVGASKSDGISTSFLEAISCGVYPIQTSTSCANEWVEKGIFATITQPNSDSIKVALTDALARRNEIKVLGYENLKVATKELDFSTIASQTRKFYV